jgi:PAS domain S-box-containing protein
MPVRAREKRGSRTADPYRKIFQQSAAALWVLDISAVREMTREWTAAGIMDFRPHLAAHPLLLLRALQSMKVVDANNETLRLYEARTRRELKGPLDPSDEGTAAAAADMIASIAEGREEISFKAAGRTAQGRRLELKVRVRVLSDEGSFPTLIAHVIDITERRRLEKALEQERSILRVVIDSIPDQVIAKDRDSRYLLVNRALTEWAGSTVPTMVGKTDLDFFPREIAEKFRTDDARVVQTGQLMANIEEEIRSSTGERRWALTTKVPLRDSSGQVSGVIAIVRDITERRALEGSLEEERDLMRTLIDALPEGVFLKDGEGRFTLANRAVAKIMSAGDPANLVGKTDRDFYPPGMADEFAADERSVHATGTAMVDKVEPKTVDGVHRWIITTKIPVRDREGRITGTVGISRDATDQKSAEDALSRERTYLASLMESLPDYVYFKDLQSRLLLTNKAHARLFHLADPADAVGKSDFDFFTAEHAQAAFDDEQRIIRTGEPVLDKEERETWPDRADTWVSTTKLPLRDEQGNVIGTMGVSRDITRRRQIEEKNLRLAAMVEYSNDAIIGIDLEDTVTSWNRGAEKIFGFTGQEMVGTSLATLITPETAQKMPGMKQNLLQQGRVQQWESVVTRKDGRQVTVSSTLSPIHDAESRIVGTTLISRDVTEQRALQVQVIRAQRLESLGTLAAGIAHQFNNINAAVKGYLDVVLMEDNLPTSVLMYTREALKGIQRSVEITDMLQTFTSSSPAGPELIALADLVPTLVPQTEGWADDEKVTIHLELHERAVVRVSRSMISFVITSLLSNSLHALLDRPTRDVTFRTKSASAYAALEVTDTGCGISADNLPRVFTPFFTTKGEWADRLSPQTRVKGIGLSLSVCQSTIAELGGWIEVESTEGVGTTFRVWLPAAPVEQAAGGRPDGT